MTTETKMTQLLEKSGLPFREIRVYGSQVVVTSMSADTAEKWAALISTFAKVRHAALPCTVDTKTGRQGWVQAYRTYATI